MIKSVSVELKEKPSNGYKPCVPGQPCEIGGAILHGDFYVQALSQELNEVCWEIRNWAPSARDGRISVQTGR
jgi:hypothetical protein